MVLELLAGDGSVLFSREYYSVGGGFVQWKGWKEPDMGNPAHPYSCMNELRSIARNEGLNIYEIMLDRLMGKPEATIRLEDPAGALEEAENMIAAIAEGIRKDVKP